MKWLQQQDVMNMLQSANFYFPEDKKLLLEYLDFLLTQVDQEHREKLIDFFSDQLHEAMLFCFGTLSDPRELLLSLFHSDFWWEKISHKEFFTLYENLLEFAMHQEHIDKEKQRIEQTYQITILPRIEEGFWHDSIYTPWLSPTSFIAAIPEIKKQIAKYPPIYIHHSKLESIIIAESFSKKEKGTHCTNLWWFTSNENNNVYLNAHRIRKSFDHELYHQAMHWYNDITDRASLRRLKDSFYQKRQLSKESKWFAYNYGKENISEDQATIAECLLRDPAHMFHRANNDPLLSKKIQLVMKAFTQLSEWRMNKNRLATLQQKKRLC